MEYGQFTFTSEPVGDFEGDLDIASGLFARIMNKAIVDDAKTHHTHHNPKRHVSAVDSRNVKLNYLYAKTINNPSP